MEDIKEFVLDTYVICVAQDSEHPGMWDALMLLGEVREKHRIALDHGRQISTEYERYILPRTAVGKWWKIMLDRSDKKMYFTGTVPTKQRTYLVDKLKFDRDDLVFVGVAHASPQKLLVAEESDYTDDVKEYINKNLEISTLTVPDALQTARS